MCHNMMWHIIVNLTILCYDHYQNIYYANFFLSVFCELILTFPAILCDMIPLLATNVSARVVLPAKEQQ